MWLKGELINSKLHQNSLLYYYWCRWHLTKVVLTTEVLLTQSFIVKSVFIELAQFCQTRCIKKKKADLPALIVLQCLRCTSACLLPCGNCLSVLKNCSKCQNRPRTACPSVWEESFKTTSEVVRFCLCFVFLKLSIHAPKSWRVFKVWVTEFSSAMLLLFLYAHPQKSQPFP